jgi:putative transposase
VVDTLGLRLKVVVHPADVHDRLGAKLILEPVGTAWPRLQPLWADQGDAGAVRQWTTAPLGLELDVASPWWRPLQRSFPDLLDEIGVASGVPVLPRRWGVERTISWLGRSRRLSKDDERLPATSAALLDVTRRRLLLARLARIPA